MEAEAAAAQVIEAQRRVVMDAEATTAQVLGAQEGGDGRRQKQQQRRC